MACVVNEFMDFGAPCMIDPDPDAETDFDPTPEHIIDLLSIAYCGKDAWLCEPLSATPEENSKANRSGTQLTYGEIHRDGLSKLLGPRGLGISTLHQGIAASHLLELGSGRGRLALQAFLQFPDLVSVIGIELVGSRHRNAVEALSRLCADGTFADTGIFDLHVDSETSPHPSATLTADADTAPRKLQLLHGDFLQIPDEALQHADVILLEVVMPPGPGRESAQLRLCEKLATHCKNGCVLASYEDLHSIWRYLPEDAPTCPFHKLQLCEGGYSTSWSTIGHHFHGFRCDRHKPSAGPGAWL